jgi:hypothetical protein
MKGAASAALDAGLTKDDTIKMIEVSPRNESSVGGKNDQATGLVNSIVNAKALNLKKAKTKAKTPAKAKAKSAKAGVEM